jgi:serine/threonine protein kinase
MPSHVPLESGDKLYKYQLQRRLGGGAFGDVWLARDHSISRDVAVKILAESVTIDERLQEARIGNHLDHENLVKMHCADIVQHEGSNLVIIAMDFHPEGSITCRLNTGNFLPMPVALRFMIDILRGLEYLNELHIYHGDIKPENILIGSIGQGVLTDYGISCQSESGQPVPPRNVYMPHVAPEVVRCNQIDARTDIYQVGMTAFRLLNGIETISEKFKRLGRSDYLTLVEHGNVIQSSDYLPFMPRNLKTIIKKAVRVEPEDRYQSALEMRRAFEHISYPGYWTCDSSGGFVGYNGNYEYRFEEQPKRGNLFDFTAFKKNRLNAREIRISAHSSRNIKHIELDVAKRKFMQWVVTG